MKLTINQNRELLELKGSLNKTSMRKLEYYLDNLLGRKEHIVLSLDHLVSIDFMGVALLQQIADKAIKMNKIFMIIGQDNQAIREAFGQWSYLLRPDSV